MKVTFDMMIIRNKLQCKLGQHLVSILAQLDLVLVLQSDVIIDWNSLLEIQWVIARALPYWAVHWAKAELKYFTYPTSTYEEFEAKPLQHRATTATSPKVSMEHHQNRNWTS